MKIIPAIDIINGQCVRLVKGDFWQKKVYSKYPLDIAMKFEQHGLQHLHLVDLDGARQKKPVNLNVLELIASKTNLKIDVGGGIKSYQNIKDVFNAGANMVTAGSVAVKNPKLVVEWLGKYGAEKIILGADFKNELISINGWETETATNIYDYLSNWRDFGFKYVISTDVSKDGLLKGPATDSYKKLTEDFPTFNVIASGGVSSMDDVFELEELNVYGAIIGKAIYEEKIDLNDLTKYLINKS